MGNICNNQNLEKQQITQTVDTFNKNFPICEFTIKNSCKVSLLLGTYKFHRSQTLLLITQADFLEYCPELREFAQNFSLAMEQVSVQRKRPFYVTPNRSCPYKKIQICILPTYNSLQSQAYLQQFQSMVHAIIQLNSDITLQLAHTSDNQNGLPNQTLMSVFLRFIAANVKKPIKLSILSNQVKLLNMVRYEVVKLEDYTIDIFNVDILC